MCEEKNVKTIDSNKTILITGAGGFLGHELLKQLLKNTKYRVKALTSNKAKLISHFPHMNQLECFSIDDWKNSILPWDEIDTLIHCAFTISSEGDELANSLLFAREVFEEANKGKVSSFINISSKSVYGSKYKPLWKETTPIAPETLYAMAKYSSEVIAKAIAVKNKKTYFTNIRLSSLIGDGLDKRVVSKFVKKVLDNQEIEIVGGKQILSFLDIHDAASGIISLLSLNPKQWKEVYNLGSSQRYNIIELANIVSDVAKDYIIKPIKIEIEEKDINLDIGMDSTLFYKDTGWIPEYSMRDSISSLFKYYLTKNLVESL